MEPEQFYKLVDKLLAGSISHIENERLWDYLFFNPKDYEIIEFIATLKYCLNNC